MSRFEPYLGAVAVLLIGICAVILANDFTRFPENAPNVPSSSTSTVAIVPNITAPQIAIPSLSLHATSTATTTATTTAEKKSATTPTPPKVTKTPTKQPAATSTAPVAAPVVAPISEPTASSGSASLDVVSATLRSALVNIICFAPAGGQIHSISGSGIIIDSKGIILTNAHIAQYLLLTKKDIDCSIRTGSPAVAAYEASLIYISPAWIHANATILTQSNPTGTGEYDFALLGITKSTTAAALPSVFPFIPLAYSPPSSGSQVVIASYGAQFLESSQILSSLYPTIVFGSIKNIFTFALNSIDVLALGGSAAAQEGSSGGGVADISGKLIGTITTSTIEGSTDTRNVDAISASYIRSQYAREMSSSLDTLLSQSISSSVADFAPNVSLLESIITAQLQ
jgi:hypothetical protein